MKETLKMKTRGGFTLIELIVVMAILAVLVLLAAPRFINQTKTAKEAHIKNDIKVTEDILSEYLIDDPEYIANLPLDAENQVHQLADNSLLLGRGGPIIDLPGGTYKNLPDAFVAKELRSKLKGDFFVDEEGTVFYTNADTNEDWDQPRIGKPTDATVNLADQIEISHYRVPNGVYRAGEVLKGSFQVKANVAGSYGVSNTIYSVFGEGTYQQDTLFTLQAGEVKTITFEHTVTADMTLGIYDVYTGVYNQAKRANFHYEFYTEQAVAIASEQWDYFIESDYYRSHDTVLGRVGRVHPDNVYFYNGAEDVSGKTGIALVINQNAPVLDNKTGMAGTVETQTYGSYEARIRMPEQPGLINGFFLYSEDTDGNFYEIDMETLYYEGSWHLWTTIHNPTHPAYKKGQYLKDNPTDDTFSSEIEPGIVFQKKINLTEMGIDPTAAYHNYRIDFYPTYVAFKLNDREVGRWNERFDYNNAAHMELILSSFWTFWLEEEKWPNGWYEELNAEWVRHSYRD